MTNFGAANNENMLYVIYLPNDISASLCLRAKSWCPFCKVMLHPMIYATDNRSDVTMSILASQIAGDLTVCFNHLFRLSSKKARVTGPL